MILIFCRLRAANSARLSEMTQAFLAGGLAFLPGDAALRELRGELSLLLQGGENGLEKKAQKENLQG